MAIKLNRTGYSHALQLIEQGKIDKESSWSFTADDENEILGDNNWSEYKKWFLAVDDEQNEDTKAHYKFPYGKNGKVYRRGVIAAKQRAAQQGYTEIADAADRLLQKIDKDDDRDMQNLEDLRLHRTFRIGTDGILDSENMIVELSFSSETPVDRWFGREILLHDRNAVDLSALVNVGAVLINHDPDQRAAKPIKAWIDEDERKGKAIIQFANTDLGRQAFKEVEEGLLRGVSVGYSIREVLRLTEDEEWRSFRGPAYIAKRWKVHEISLTPIPADATVGVGRTENLDIRGNEMKEDRHELRDQQQDNVTNVVPDDQDPKALDEVLEQERQKERQRVMEIRALCKTHGVRDIEDELIERGVSIDEARKIILDKLADRYKPIGMVEVGVEEREKVRSAIVDSILVRGGVLSADDNLSAGYNDYVGRSLFDIARECLDRAGVSYRGLSKLEIVGRAITHTSSDFPIILQNVANKALMQGFEAEPETWQQWCSTGSVGDFNEHTMVRVGEFDDLDEVPESAEYRHAQAIAEQQEKYSIATYGKLFSITRQAIINDSTALNALTVIPRNMGEAAKRKIGDLAYSVLTSNPTMGDGNALFSSAHNNVASAGSEPTSDAIKEGIKRMMMQKDIGGKRRLHIRPQFIIVPVAYSMEVEELLNAQYIDFAQGKPNILRKYNLTPIADGRLDDAGTAWYLAGPKGKTVVLYFLDGKQTPTLESRDGWTVDGVEYKVRIDVGAKAVTWKALYKNPGA